MRGYSTGAVWFLVSAIAAAEETRINLGSAQDAKAESANVNAADNANWAPRQPQVSSDVAACCSALAQMMPLKTLSTPSATAYSAHLKTYWANEQRDLSPGCFVLPTSTEEVSKVISLLTSGVVQRQQDARQGGPAEEKSASRPWWRFWDRKKSKAVNDDGRRSTRTTDNPASCPFAIRSGGHSPIAGWSNIEAGITLDLSNFKSLEVAADRSYINIAPGNRWGDVYSQLDGKDVGTSGGRAATVGVGGLVTGGGISFFSRERGLVCDNVLEFEVVLANGTVVLANQYENADLYRALKGGSGNFGIVTRIKMRAFDFPGGRMWGGTLFHRGTDTARENVFNHFANYTSSPNKNVAWINNYSIVNAILLKPEVSTSNVHYTLPEPSLATDFFKPILGSDTTLYNGAKISTLTNLTQEISNFTPAGSRQIFVTFTFKNSPAFMEEFYQMNMEAARSVQNTFGLAWTLAFQAFPYSFHARSAETGGNSLGLEGETNDLILTLLTISWSLAKDDEELYDVTRELVTKAKIASEKAGLGASFTYLNYAQQWQDPIGAYGEQTVQRLRDVAARYDPRGVFKSQVPGGFKIPATGQSDWRSRVYDLDKLVR